MLGENSANNAITGAALTPIQSDPAISAADGSMLQSLHNGVINVGMADGSVRPLVSSIDAVLFWSTVTPAGGEQQTINGTGN